MVELSKRLKVLRLQYALFLDHVDLSNKLTLADEVLSASGNFFDGEPMVLPMPTEFRDVPPDIPRIVLKDKQGRYRCNVCANRVDLIFIETGEPGAVLDDVWTDYFPICQKICEYVKSNLKTKIVRLGLVAGFFLKLKGSANRHLNTNYLQRSLFQNPYEIQFNILNKTTVSNFNVNRWVKFRPLRKEKDLEDDTAMSVEIDINTLPEEVRDFLPREVEGFYKAACDHIKKEDVKLIVME